MNNALNFYNGLAQGLASMKLKLDLTSDGFFSNISLDKVYTDALYDELVTKVCNEVILYKESMLPVINVLSVNVKAYMEKNMKYIDKSPVKLIEVSVPKLTEILVSSGKVNKDVTYDSIIVGSGVSIPQPDVSKVLTFSTPELSNAVNALLIGKGKDYLSKIWDKYFANIDNDNQAITEMNLAPMTKLDENTLVFTICNQILADTTLLGNNNALTASYVQGIGKLAGKAANAINRGILLLENNDKFGKLIISVTKDEVYVSDAIYDEYVKTHSVEAILGLVLSTDSDNSRLYSMKSVIENSDKYIVEWNKYLHVANQALNTENAEVFRKAYLNSLMDLLKNELSDELKELTPYQDIKSIVILEQYLHTYLLSLPAADLMNITAMSEKLVSDYLFSTSNLGNYLKYMNNILSTNTDMKPDEAAIYATGELVIKYLTTQIRLLKV